MKRTPLGTPVGVDDPLEAVDRCDWVTAEGRCRFARDRPEADPTFTAARRREDYRCPYAGDDRGWEDCRHFRSRGRSRACVRCGLAERPMAHDPDARPLLHEHHLAYGDEDEPEVTVTVCRWCHAKIHRGTATIDDDADPDPDAVAAFERRRDRERAEAFRPASERRDG